MGSDWNHNNNDNINNTNYPTTNNQQTLNNINQPEIALDNSVPRSPKHVLEAPKGTGHIATVEGFVGRRLTKILLDSGADFNYISRKMAETVRCTIKDVPDVLEIEGAGGASLFSFSCTTITVTIGLAQGLLDFRVVEDEVAELPFVILGVSTLHDMEARFYKDPQGQALLTIAHQECYLDEARGVFRPRVLDLEMVEPPIDEDEPLDLELNFDEMSPEHVWNSHMIASAKEPLLTRKGTVFATLQKETTMEDVPENLTDVGNPDLSVLEALNKTQLAKLHAIQQGMVELTLLKLEDAKAPPKFSMGEQYLTLKTGDPNFPGNLVETQRLHGKVNQTVLQQYCEEGIRNGNIELADPAIMEQQEVRCTTNHCFPVSGRGAAAKVRVSIVARLLNLWTVTVGIFRLIIDQVKQRVDPTQCQYMSVLDIRWAFNLIEITESMRPRTTFYGWDAQLHWYKRMPFGLKNAPACWQAFVSSILKGIPNVIVFVDDIFLFSPTVEAHLELLQRIVNVFKEHNVPVRWQKIQLLRPKVNFLGAIWSRGGVIQPNVASMETVEKFPIPRDKKQLKSFLGVCRWLAQYVPDLEKHLHLLQTMVKHNADFKWSAEHQAAFEESKEAIRNRLSVNLPDYSETAQLFKVVTDASDWGFGAILIQGDRLLSCYSHAWNDKEIRWGTITQEAYGVYATLNHWRDMLYGVHFELETDHRPLIHIMAGLAEGKGSKMVNRWFTFLLQFDMKIRHIPGTDNVMADYLSRMSTGSEEQTRAFLCVKTPELTVNDLVDGDQDDQEGARLYSMRSLGHCPYCNRVNDVEAKPRQARILYMKISEAKAADTAYLALVELVNRSGQPDKVDPLEWPPEHPLFEHRQLIAKNADKYFIDRERLWYQEDGDATTEAMLKEPSLVVPESQQRYLFQELHSSMLAGHGGLAATMARFERYHWPGKEETLKDWIQHCERCQRAKLAPPANVRRRPLQPCGVWERVHVDLVDMTKNPSSAGHKYILVVRDSFSRFTFARALYDKTAQRVAWKLWRLFAEAGQPSILFVDDGSEFVNELNQEFVKQAGVHLVRSATLMKSTNGTVERAIRIVHQYLRLVNAGQLWNRYLSFMCHANNSSVCTATGQAPCVLFYGRQFVFNREFQALRHQVANLKADEWEPRVQDNQRDGFSTEKFADFLKDWDEVREVAKQKDASQKRQEKRRFERRRRADKVPIIAKGMRVLLEADPDASGHKDRDLYEGPVDGYEVVHADPDGLNVTIRDGDTKRTVHAAKLRVFRLEHEPEPPRSGANSRSNEVATADKSFEIDVSSPVNTAVDAAGYAAPELHLSDDVGPNIQKPMEELVIEPDDAHDEDPVPSDEFEVRRVLAARGRRGEDRVYRVDWIGYGLEERSDVAEYDMAPNQMLTEAEALWPDAIPRFRWHYRGDAFVEADEIEVIRRIGHERSSRSERGRTSRRDCVVTLVMNLSLPKDRETTVSIAAFSDDVASRPHIFENDVVMEQFVSARDAWKRSEMRSDDK